MPAERLQPRRQRQDVGHRRVLAQVAHEVEAHAAEAARVEAAQLGIIHVGGQQGDAAVIVRPGGHRILGGPVVEAVAGRLHHHAALQAEPVVQREQRLLGRVLLRHVGRVRRVGKALARPEHMAVGVAGAGR